MPKIEIEDTELNDLKTKATEVENLKKELETLKSKKDEAPPPPPKETVKDDEDLDEKVKRKKDAETSLKSQTKALESALKFNMGVEGWVKENEDLLPSDFPDIIKQAENEKYDAASEKASAIRRAMIKTFFKLESNVDLLTATQKTTLEDYQKLTKSGQDEKSEFIFQNIFEPAVEMTRKLKKAEELGKARMGLAPDKAQDAYKNKLMKLSRKTYLGEKETV